MAAHNYQDAAAAAGHVPRRNGTPHGWVQSQVPSGTRALAAAAAQPPLREVAFPGGEGANKSPEEMAKELLNKMDDLSMFKLAKVYSSMARGSASAWSPRGSRGSTASRCTSETSART
ncbi:unnamed protein product, partial [Prorocentrum cordatum]